MKLYGRANEVANLIIEKFESGDVPDALAQVFINRGDIPSCKWSWGNQLLMVFSGTMDARGYEQWKEVGRQVTEGKNKAIYILGPCLKTIKVEDEATDEEKTKQILYGFKSIPVFPIEVTEVVDEAKWDANGGAVVEKLETLPLVDVAKEWGLEIRPFNGGAGRPLGSYVSTIDDKGLAIQLGVENLSTWTHELVHAADERNGTLTKGKGQEASNEIVAELGGSIILKMMGMEMKADIGGAWNYIKGYAGEDKGKTLQACNRLIDRVCKCIALIMDTAAKTDKGVL